MTDSYLPRLVEELKAHGVTTWEVDDQGRHYKLRFEWNGVKLMHIFPRSPSDHRGMENSLSDLRKTLGVRRIIQKCSAKPKVRSRPVTPAQSGNLRITVKPDPFAALAAFKQSKELRACPRMTLAQIARMLNS